MHLEQVLIRPLLTEKSTVLTENDRKYAFEVQLKANKYQIKDAVEKLFDVKVENIATTISPGKVKRFGRHVKKSSSVKKAYVQIKEGQKLDLFKGI